MKKFFESLQHIFKRPSESGGKAADEQTNGSEAGNDNNPAMDEAAIASLMQLIERTKEGEYTCEETLDLLDEYVELVNAGQNVAEIMPLVKGHISDCPDCTERYEALITILQTS